jgi:hypothetical protein
MKLWGMRPAMHGIMGSAAATGISPENGDDHDGTQEQCADRSPNHQRQTLAREVPELAALGFDLSTDGDADQRDEDERAGRGQSPATHAD